jgi:hypothetical protein
MTNGESVRARAETINQTVAQYYAPNVQHLSTPYHHRNFARSINIKGKNAPKVNADSNDLRRFSLVQVKITDNFYNNLYLFNLILLFRLIMLRNCSKYLAQISIVEQLLSDNVNQTINKKHSNRFIFINNCYLIIYRIILS